MVDLDYYLCHCYDIAYLLCSLFGKLSLVLLTPSEVYVDGNVGGGGPF